MEKVRDILNNHPILISPAIATIVNSAVGGSKNSVDTHGLAVDFSALILRRSTSAKRLSRT